MTSLNPSPRLVSAVQVATTLPFFLLTLPAGALTDVVDPRRLLIVAQRVIAAVSIAFGAVVSAGLASPPSLLATSFLMGLGGAFAAPAWLLITPILVPRSDLDSAIAIDTASYNVARAIGPAIAGYAIAWFSIALPFWCCCAGNLGLLAALIWWRAPCKAKGNAAGRTPDQRDDDRAALRSLQPRDGRDAHPRHRLLSLRQRLSRAAAPRGARRQGRGGGLWPTHGGDRRRLDPCHIVARLAEDAARPERTGRGWGRSGRSPRSFCSPRRVGRRWRWSRASLRAARRSSRSRPFLSRRRWRCRIGCAAGAWRFSSLPISAR